MGLKLITAPSALAVDLARVKEDLRIDDSVQDALLAMYIKAATEACEHRTGRKLMDQTWELALDAFPDSAIDLPFYKTSAIVSVKYIDTSGTEQTIINTNYTLDNYDRHNWMLPAVNYTWPNTLGVANAVKVQFKSGEVSNTDVPESIKTWIILAVRDIMLCCPDGDVSLAKGNRFYDSFLDQHIDWTGKL